MKSELKYGLCESNFHRSMTYQQKLRHPLWQKKRLEALNMAGWKCQRCEAVNKPLHVHHKIYRKGLDPWEYTFQELESLCEQCHTKEHQPLRGQGRFENSKHYRREVITEILNCPPKGFLPMVSGHVVCGFFRIKYNPDAPDIILSGNYDYIREPTEIFCAQSFPVPIFLSVDTALRNELWEYAGDYRVGSWTGNAIEIGIQSKRAPQHPKIWRVLFLNNARERTRG